MTNCNWTSGDFRIRHR